MKKKIAVIIISLVLVLVLATVVISVFVIPSLKAQKEAVQYLSDKYGIALNELTPVQYKARAVHTAFLNGANVYPETCIVNTAEGKRISVVREEDHWADNYQLLDISYMAADYFSELLKCDVDFVEYNSISSGNKQSQILETYLKRNNNLWNKSNFKLFIEDFASQQDNLMNLYIKNSDMDPNHLNLQSQGLAEKLPSGCFNLIYHDVSLNIINAQERNPHPDLCDFECYIVDNNPLQAYGKISDHFIRFPVNYENGY